MTSKIQTKNIPRDFKVQKTNWISALKSHVLDIKHTLSGARLVFIKNKDPAKTFSIAFKTPPYDDTGVFHIFEHSVLAGSKRYPSKSLFFSLYASSLASTLNASTHPVFTQYYYSSTLKKDFLNLLRVYLDAVFYPNVTKNQNIVKREGFRIEWNEKTKNFQYNGIVFSEMKGVFAEPLRHLYSQVMKSLLFQTPYAFDSGGDPEKIIQLSFDQIKEAHKKYYHPDNSLIYLYGDLEIKETLSILHEEFLKNFKKRKNFKTFEIKKQKTFKSNALLKSTYPAVSKKNLTGKTFMSLNYLLGKALSLETLLSIEIIGSALFDEESSPGKKRIRDLQLAKDISFHDFETQENMVCILLEGVSSAKDQKKIKTLIESILKESYKKGLPQNLIESTLNTKEFSLKEALFNSPSKGLGLRSYVFNHWLQEKNHELKDDLEFLKRFENVRKKLKDSSSIQKLIQKHFIENKKKSFVVLSPNPHQIQDLDQKIKRQLKKELQGKNLDQLKIEDQKFKDWQNAIEPKKITQKIPRLNPSSLSPEIESLKYKKKIFKKSIFSKKNPKIPEKKSHLKKENFLDSNELEIYSFPENTGGINYLDLHFDLSPIEEKDLHLLSLILYLLQKINTKNRNFSELTNLINENLGDLSFYIETFHPIMKKKGTSKKENSSSKPKLFYPHLIVSSKFLNHKSRISFDLIHEILTQSLFEPENQVKSLILELINDKKTSVTDRASYLASLSGESSFSNSAKWMTYIDGHMAEMALRKLEKNILKNPSSLQKIIKTLKKTFSLLFTQNNLELILLIGEKENLETLNHLSEKFFSKLKKIPSRKFLQKNESLFSNPQKKSNFFKSYKAIDGFEIPSPVQYNHMKAPYFQIGKSFSGKMLVFSRILIFEYLMKLIREQNGAYGANAKINAQGIFLLSSYRDPKLKKTFDIFESIPQFFDTLKLEKKTLNSFIVGALTPYYTPKSPYEKTRAFIDRKCIHMSEKSYQRIKKEILETKINDIQKINDDIKKILSKAKKTTAGGKEKIAKEAPFVKEKLSL